MFSLSSAKLIGTKIQEQKGKSTLSPASAPLGVSTRRSSMSPRMATSTPIQPSSKATDTLRDEKSNAQPSAKVSNKTEASAVSEDKTLNKDAKGNVDFIGLAAFCTLMLHVH